MSLATAILVFLITLDYSTNLTPNPIGQIGICLICLLFSYLLCKLLIPKPIEFIILTVLLCYLIDQKLQITNKFHLDHRLYHLHT